MALTFPAADTTPIPSALSRAAAKLRPAGPNSHRLAWLQTARPDQLPPPGYDWTTLLILAGRGWGKTKTGSEHVAQFARDNPGAVILAVGRTDFEARRDLLRGGLMHALAPEEIDRKVEAPGATEVWLKNGSRIHFGGASSPESFRGLNLWMAWFDEMASWRYQQTIWDETVVPAIRKGPHPHVLITTTPKPTPLIKKLIRDPDTRIVRGSTFDNAANLSPRALDRIRKQYDVDENGRARTRAGRQEINAEVLEDMPGALLTQAVLDQWRVVPIIDDNGDVMIPGAKLDTFGDGPMYRESVIGLDPSDGMADGDEQALTFAGLGFDHNIYVERVEGMRVGVVEYLETAVDLAVKHHASLVVEKNHGGKYLTATLNQVMKDKGVVVAVRMVTASDGKRTRAEPMVPLFQSGKVRLVGVHTKLEDQLTGWTGAKGEKSPDRVDSCVWAISPFLGHRLAPPSDDDGDGGYSFVQGSDDWADDYGSGAYSYG